MTAADHHPANNLRDFKNFFKKLKGGKFELGICLDFSLSFHHRHFPPADEMEGKNKKEN